MPLTFRLLLHRLAVLTLLLLSGAVSAAAASWAPCARAPEAAAEPVLTAAAGAADSAGEPAAALGSSCHAPASVVQRSVRRDALSALARRAWGDVLLPSSTAVRPPSRPPKHA